MAKLNNKPLRRHDALAPLSRDHYVGLVQARHLIRAARGDEVARRGVVAEFIGAWHNDVAVHFRDEERLLLPHMNEADRERLLNEHRILTALAERVCEERKSVSPDPTLLLKLGEKLEAHIRWEERDLFGRLQSAGDDASLAALQESTETLEKTRRRDVSRQKVWKRKQQQLREGGNIMAQINPTTSIGKLVREQPSRVRVFESLGLEYCCGGKATLDEACRTQGLELQGVIERIAEEDARGDNMEFVDADALSLSELADHIESEHHAYLRTELPRLDAMTEKVMNAHGDTDDRLASLRAAFCSVRDELMSHMLEEERTLFPRIRELETSRTCDSAGCGSIRGTIHQMEHEHDSAGEALAAMRTLTDDYTPPEWACNTYRAMLDGLATLESDMHQHVHKENNVLFPKALAMEGEILSAP